MQNENSQLAPIGPQELMRHSTDVAGVSKEIVMRTAMSIQGRKYVKLEGWQAIAVAHGCMLSACDVERVDGGVRAMGEVRRMQDGVLLAKAEGFVGEDETTWYGGEVISYGKTKIMPKRPDYAIRAMAQTRAMSRAARSAFAHVVVLIDTGLSTTPAEEVPLGGFDNEDVRQESREQRDESSRAKGPEKPVQAAKPESKASTPPVQWRGYVQGVSDPAKQGNRTFYTVTFDLKDNKQETAWTFDQTLADEAIMRGEQDAFVMVTVKPTAKGGFELTDLELFSEPATN